MKNQSMFASLRVAALLLPIAIGSAHGAGGGVDLVAPGETRLGDQFIGASGFRHDGAIKGDLFVWAQYAHSTGTISGDLIGAGQEVKISGSVDGDVRVAGKSVQLTGKVGRNVMVAGMEVTGARELGVAGSLIACGQNLVIDGDVRGTTRVYGEKITLKGVFHGDVFVNVIDIDKKDRGDWEIADVLTVAPGAVIHGKLTFQGATADIKSGAKVASFQWIKIDPAASRWLSKENRKRVWGFVRFLLTTIALFLLGMLLHRLFPALFGKMGEFAGQKPWSAILYGLLTALSTVPALVLFIVLLAMSLILSPGLSLLFGSVAGVVYTALYVLSSIPVGLWLGNRVFRGNANLTSRFGWGLLLWSGVLWLISLLASLHVGGSLFSVLSFMAKFASVLFGSGVLLYLIKEIFLAAQRD